MIVEANVHILAHGCADGANTLDGSAVPMDHDFELVWQPTRSAAPRAMTFTETIDGKPYFLVMLMPPDQPP